MYRDDLILCSPKRHVITAAGIEAQTSTSGLAQEVHLQADNANNAAEEAAATARVPFIFFCKFFLILILLPVCPITPGRPVSESFYAEAIER